MMRYYKGSELIIGKLYQDHEGLYVYKGQRNDYIYSFDEIEIVYDDQGLECYETVGVIQRLYNELYFENERWDNEKTS